MQELINNISGILATNAIPILDISRQEIDDTDEYAIAITLEQTQELSAWNTLHDQVQQTGYYPVVVEDWVGDKDFFSRFWYEEERTLNLITHVDPQHIISEVGNADISACLHRRATTLHPGWTDDIDYELERTQKQFGKSPLRQEINTLIAQHTIQSLVDLERWLFYWELQTFGDTATIATIGSEYLAWYTHKNTPSVLLLVPVREGWNVLAYLHWYGALKCGTPTAIAMMNKWYIDYGAALVCHYGTMLQCVVSRPPVTPEVAFQLAWEQVALAECTTILPGVTIREHARTLLFNTRWFLHERP